MATMIDFAAERTHLERAIGHARRERDKAALKARSDDASDDDMANLEQVRSRLKRREDQLAELDGAEALQQEVRLENAEVERLRARDADGEQVRELLAAVPAIANRIDEAFAEIGKDVEELIGSIDQAYSLTAKNVAAPDDRRMDRYAVLQPAFSRSTVARWLEAAAVQFGLVPGTRGATNMAATPLEEVLRSRLTDLVGRLRRHEFPNLNG